MLTFLWRLPNDRIWTGQTYKTLRRATDARDSLIAHYDGNVLTTDILALASDGSVIATIESI